MAFPLEILKRTPWPLILALGGCAAGTQFLHPQYSPPRVLAVLPLDNLSTDLDGPIVVRYWLDRRLAQKKGYRTLPLERVDEALLKRGISDGGQLRALDLKAFGAELGAEAFIVGELLDFSAPTTGFLNVRRVRIRLRMLTPSGERLWESEGNAAASTTALTPAKAAGAAAAALGSLWLEKIQGNPLEEQTLDAIWNALEFLPPGS